MDKIIADRPPKASNEGHRDGIDEFFKDLI
jgi:hypothetical protein